MKERLKMHCRAGDAAVLSSLKSSTGAGECNWQKSVEGVNCASVQNIFYSLSSPPDQWVKEVEVTHIIH